MPITDKDLGILGQAADLFGSLDPKAYQDAIAKMTQPGGGIVPANPSNQPAPMTSSLGLRPFNTMSLSQVQPPPATSFNMKPLLGAVPPAPAEGTPQRSLLSRVGGVLGKVGEIAGSALIPNEMKWIPGTEQYKGRQEMAGQEREKFATEQEKEKALTEQARAKAEEDRAQAEREARTPAEKNVTEAQLEQQARDAWLQANPGKTDADWFAYKASLTHQPREETPEAQAITLQQTIDNPQTTPEQKAEAQRKLDSLKKGVAAFRPPPEQKETFEERTFEDWLKQHPGGNREQFMEDREGRVAARQEANQERTFAHQDQAQQARWEHQTKVAAARETQLTSPTKTMIEMAPTVKEFVNRIELLTQREAQAGDLGPLKGRWSEFMTGKIGAPNPEYAKLRTDITLMRSALLKMHVGSRGSQVLLQEFKDIMDQGKDSPENMLAALGEISSYADDLIARGRAAGIETPATLGAGGGGAATPETHVFNVKAWQAANPKGDVNAAKAAAKAQKYTIKE